jgi:hypothetical protein
LLHPAADPGVPGVSRTPASSRSEDREHREHLPAGRCTPRRMFPRRQPFHVTVVRAPLLFVQLRGLAPSSGPRPSLRPCGPRAGPILPWAFFPFEVSSPADQSSVLPSSGAPPAHPPPGGASRVASLRSPQAHQDCGPGGRSVPPRWRGDARRCRHRVWHRRRSAVAIPDHPHPKVVVQGADRALASLARAPGRFPTRSDPSRAGLAAQVRRERGASRSPGRRRRRPGGDRRVTRGPCGCGG